MLQFLTMNDSLDIDIRPADAAELDLLRQRFDPRSALNYHQSRYAVQERGNGVYLIAWHGADPVGHFLLRWDGPADDPTGQFPHETACLEAGATLPEFQRRGVATRLIGEAERLACARGFQRIGLAVGSTDNPTARRLYERLGYVAWDGGEFTISWDYEALDGRKGTESEVCIYMFKTLSCDCGPDRLHNS